jgi:hypothetical protein
MMYGNRTVTAVGKSLQGLRRIVKSSYRREGASRVVLAQVIVDGLQIHRRQPEPTECASGLEHPVDPGVHLPFLDELATRDLVDSH